MPTMMIGTEIMGTSLSFIHPDLPIPRADRAGLSLQLVNANLQGIQDLCHPHLAPLGDWLRSLGVPEFTMDEDLAIGAEVGLSRPDFSHQTFLAGKGFFRVGPDHEEHEKQEDQGQADGQRDYDVQARLELGDRGIDEHDGTDNHGDDSSCAQYSKTLNLDLEDEQTDGQKDQEQRHVVDGQNLEREDGQQKADRSEHSGQDGAGGGELKIQAEKAEHQQDVGQVGVGDREKEFLPGRHGDVNHHFAFELKLDRLSADPLHGSPAQPAKDLLLAAGNEIDQALLH